jgi:hypothetical protein
MRVKWPVPPAGVRAAMDAGLPLFVAADETERMLLVNSGRGIEQIAQRVFWVDAESVGDAAPGREHQHSKGWRFLSRNGAGAMASAYVSEGPDGPEVTSVSLGERLKWYFEMPSKSQSIADGLPGEDCEGRVLAIPSAYVEAVWLVPPNGTDWMIPSTTIVPELNTQPVYSGDEFRELCSRIAKDSVQKWRIRRCGESSQSA